MGQPPYPLQFLVVAVAGWINQQQRDVIAYPQEENRVLREQLGPRRLRFTDGPTPPPGREGQDSFDQNPLNRCLTDLYHRC